MTRRVPVGTTEPEAEEVEGSMAGTVPDWAREAEATVVVGEWREAGPPVPD